MWSFIQDYILGMKWLNSLVYMLLERAGIDPASRLFVSLQFFIYDTIKIMVLLCTLIFMISYIQSYFSTQKSRRILGRFKGIRANIISALLGTVTPFCSCSSIPLFMGFTSAKLPIGVSFSFLISSPMVDLGSLLLLTSIFGLKIALIYVIFGLVVAILGGALIERLHMEKYLEDFVSNAKFIDTNESEPTVKDRLVFAKEQMLFTLKKVYLYIFIGVGIGAYIHNFIPEELVLSMLGSDNPFAVILASIIGVPMYADIFGVIPVAEALLLKGASLGVVLSFMMSVTTLSLPSIVLLHKAVKMPLLVTFVLICTIGIILCGYLFNFISPYIL
ncbi:MAG: permease [Aeromonadales bacterium]|nr:permease [Aeromonadales bacterium]